MSEEGQTRKYRRPSGMSVLPSGADIIRLHAQVRFVPIPEVTRPRLDAFLERAMKREEDPTLSLAQTFGDPFLFWGRRVH
jgi:hypothetical protein